MKALARVGVLEQMGAVEVGQPVRVGREVRGHPVQNDANAVLMQVVHQIHEVLRRSVARSGREIARGLVTPRTVERMLHDGHQFHVSEVHPLDIFRQARRHLPVGQRPVAFLRDPHPRTEMNFVNRNRGLQRFPLCPGFHPLLISPLVFQLPHYRGGTRRLLMKNAEGIGLLAHVSLIVRNDVVLVQRPLADSRHKTFPDTRT